MSDKRIDQRGNKATPVAADMFPIIDSEDLNPDGHPKVKEINWEQIQAALGGGGGGSGAVAWAAFDGVTPQIIGSSNILSLDQVATGHYKLTFATTLATSTYAAVFGTQRQDGGSPFVGAAIGLGELADFDGSHVDFGSPIDSVSITPDGNRGFSFSGGNSGNWGYALMVLPDTGCHEISVKCTSLSSDGNDSGRHIGVFFSNLTDSTMFIGFHYAGNGQVAFNGSWQDTIGSNHGYPLWAKIVFDGSGYSLQYSYDGTNYTQLKYWTIADIGGVDLPYVGVAYANKSHLGSGGVGSGQVEFATTDNIPSAIPAKTEGHLYIETFNPATGTRLNAPLVCVAIHE